MFIFLQLKIIVTSNAVGVGLAGSISGAELCGKLHGVKTKLGR